MNLPKFEDVHPGHNAGGYTSTNEEPRIHTALIEAHHPEGFQRAAAISSGGEIPILVLLTRAEEVVAIDHSYMALAYAYLKVALLSHMGAVEFHKQMLKKDEPTMLRVQAEAKSLMPLVLRDKVYSHPSILYGSEFWAVPIETLELILSRLDKLTFVHGDLTDLTRYGVFDVLYISNALEHTGRSGKSPKMEDFRTIVKEDGGLVLLTSAKSSTNAKYAGPFDGWEALNATKGNIVGDMWKGQTWDYRLLRKCPMPPPVLGDTTNLPATL